MGVFSIQEALALSRKQNLDLIQVTEKVDPPICKIMEYGKYLYWLQKKEKTVGTGKGGEMKGIRLTFNISLHDMETRAHQAEKFLKKGDKIRIEMPLRGREKAHGEFAKEKLNHFLEILKKIIPIKTERELKREMRGFTMIVTKE